MLADELLYGKIKWSRKKTTQTWYTTRFKTKSLTVAGTLLMYLSAGGSIPSGDRSVVKEFTHNELPKGFRLPDRCAPDNSSALMPSHYFETTKCSTHTFVQTQDCQKFKFPSFSTKKSEIAGLVVRQQLTFVVLSDISAINVSHL